MSYDYDYSTTERYCGLQENRGRYFEEYVDHVCKIAGLFNATYVADFGAGNGKLCIELARKGFYVYSVDIPSKTSDYAKQRYEEEGLVAYENKIQQCTPEEFFKLDFIDLVACFGTFEHLTNPIRTMHQIYRTIKRGGIFILHADLHNFSPPNIYDHYVYEPVLTDLMIAMGYMKLDENRLAVPHFEGQAFTFGTIKMEVFQKICDGDYGRRYRRVVERWEL